MTEESHLDTSWTAFKSEFDEVYVYSEKYDHCICEMMHADSPEEMFCNADLIAATPKLYKALQGLMSQLKREGGPVTLEMMFAKELLDTLEDSLTNNF